MTQSPIETSAGQVSEFIAQAHDPNWMGPARNKPVLDQFSVWAVGEEDAAKKALSMAQERANGNFRQITILRQSRP